MASKTLVTALVLSPIRRRNDEGELEILKPDGNTTGKFNPREAQYLAEVGAIRLPESEHTKAASEEQHGRDTSSDDPMPSLVEAIGELDPDNKKHFTTTGKPEVAALKKAAEVKTLSAAQRDAAWEQWKKENPPASSGEGSENTGAPPSGNAGTADGQGNE